MKFFRALAGTGIVGMTALAFVGEGFQHTASLIYVVSAVGFFGANLFTTRCCSTSPRRRNATS